MKKLKVLLLVVYIISVMLFAPLRVVTGIWQLSLIPAIPLALFLYALWAPYFRRNKKRRSMMERR